jgi:hypothetical protein
MFNEHLNFTNVLVILWKSREILEFQIQGIIGWVALIQKSEI